MTMKVVLELYDCRELAMAYDAMDRIQAHRDNKRWPGGVESCKVTPTQPSGPRIINELPSGSLPSATYDVPAVPLETVLEELHAGDDPVVGDETLPAASVEDATAAMRAAIDRGVQLPAIVKILEEKHAKRVPELNEFDRADFTVRVKALQGK